MHLRILIFEPHYGDFQALAKALREAGLEVDLHQATTREEFWAALKECSPDVVLVDIGRGEGVDNEALMWSQNASVSHGRAPVIIVTEPLGDMAAVRALKAGASDYVLKTELGRLGDAIRSAVQERQEGEKQVRSMRDLRHAAEQIRESQKLVTIGRLSGMITHEINNPLAAIANLLYLLNNEGSLSANALKYLQLAEKEMERVVQISRQTLSFYRETNAPERQKPKDLIEEVLSLYRRNLMEKNIAVRRRYDFDGAIMIYPGEMRQVLSNLVVNAIEAMQPAGCLTVHVYETRRWSDISVCGVRVVIADTGAGISAEKLHQIGEPFFTTKGQKGTGLGLWVSQGIVRKYGGDLQVSSSTNPQRHGTVFSVFLPTELGPRVQGRGGSADAAKSRYGAQSNNPAQRMNA